MPSRQSCYRFVAIVLITAVVLVGSGVPPSAEAQQAPPRSPIETIIQPGGMKGERHGLDYHPGDKASRTAHDHAKERFPHDPRPSSGPQWDCALW